MFDPGQLDDLIPFSPAKDEKEAQARGQWGSVIMSPSQLFPSMRTNVSEWMNKGRRLSDQVQSLVTNSPIKQAHTTRFAIESSSPSLSVREEGDEGGEHNQLAKVSLDTVSLESVVNQFKRQDEINVASTQLSRLNYMANVANFIKHKQIEVSIMEGQRQLAKMNSSMQQQSGQIRHLNHSVSSLRVEVEDQREKTDRLKTSLDTQQQLFGTAIQENRSDIERQQGLLNRQQAIMDNMMKQKLRHDLLVDSGLILTCVYMTNSILVDFPIKLIFSIVPKTKLRKWLQSLAKFIVIIKVFTNLKAWSIKCGVHHSVGSFVPYMQQIIDYFMQKWRPHQAMTDINSEENTKSQNLSDKS